MRKLIGLALACLGLLAGFVVSAAPASAYIADPMINGRKFATTALCVGSTLNQSTYRVGYVAQTINVATEDLALTYSTNCAGLGYTASKRMVVGTFNNPDYPYCTLFTNQQSAEYNGFQRWTNGPGMYLNVAHSACVSTQTRRDHWISQMMNWHLGLTTLDSTGWNSHVMNQTDYSQDNVGTLHYSEGVKLDEIYRGVFCNVGTVC
jgi:hypothetical protein